MKLNVTGSISVSDPHSLYTDPDPAFLRSADLDPDQIPDPDSNLDLKVSNSFQSEIQIHVLIQIKQFIQTSLSKICFHPLG
jgi:hypothetical protein